MATIVLPDLDERTLDQARAVVAAQGGSLEQELSRVVEARARETASEAERHRRAAAAMDAMATLARRLEAEYGTFPSTTEMIRQERDAW